MRSICFALFLAGAGACSKQTTTPSETTPPVPDAQAAPSAAATVLPAPSAAAASSAASIGDARLDCAQAAKERDFIETHKACTVDQDCTRSSTWLYPCGATIQKKAVHDLEAVDRSVSTACMRIGFHAPERDCTAAVLRSACSNGSCVNVVPMPLPNP